MFHYVVLHAIVHSTEDVKRVTSALRFLLPMDDGYVVEESQVEGHYGNEIALLEAKVTNKRDVKRFVDLLCDRLLPGDLSRLRSELVDRVDDECMLHIRFDKQEAFMGRLALAKGQDVISARLKIKAYPASKENALSIVSDLF
ncbi:exosome subunit [Methanosarcinales archaeon ex4572_44]|nr:MAG: exosome subunit [Methanosarcinales archaeon ex4484_138]PHP45967.1 MAG: exosome subunit [Methanosarcinales archaeon ex4572_44]RLG26321.1 MAG: exosome subunit [Methanosarcinales archaeon]RLG28360.1 MAG: exosome subunit [Methanosarcinales archaeon]